MGILRTIGLILTAILFFAGMLATNGMLAIVNSLDHEVIKANIYNIGIKTIEDKYASELNGVDLDLIIQETNFSKEVDTLLNENYDKKYDCSFFECLQKEGPLYLTSKHAQDYWKSKFYLFLGITILLFLLIILLVEKKSNALILAGILVILSALPLLLLEKILSGFVGDFLEFLNFLFTSAYWTAIKVIAFGVIAILLGIIWKIFNIGLWLEGKFSNGNKNESTKVDSPIDKS